MHECCETISKNLIWEEHLIPEKNIYKWDHRGAHVGSRLFNSLKYCIEFTVCFTCRGIRLNICVWIIAK